VPHSHLLTTFLSDAADEVDEHGFLKDIDVETVDDVVPSHEGKTRDIDHFFGAPYAKQSTNGSVKKYRDCETCQ
jgi:hypothetical protein